MNIKPEAILFDLDDTIIAWDAVSDHVWMETCRRYAPALEIEPETLYDSVKWYRSWYLSDWKRHEWARLNLPAYRIEVVSMALKSMGLPKNGLVEKIAGYYGEGRENQAYLLPGAIETLRYFKQQGIKLALVSNSMADMQRRKIGRFDLEQYFDIILIEGEFGAGKPEKRVFQHILREMQVTSSEAWMVGDNLYFDIAGGKSAGLYTVWVDWAGVDVSKAEVKPDRTVERIAELLPR